MLIYVGIGGVDDRIMVYRSLARPGYWMIFASLFVSRIFLGGQTTGGLIKPFSGKGPRSSPRAPSLLALGLRLYDPRPEERVYENDERELRQRDRVHYWAYQALVVALLGIWLLTSLKINAPRLAGLLHVSAGRLLYGLVLATIIVSVTLPQAILLWTEPDMEEVR